MRLCWWVVLVVACKGGPKPGEPAKGSGSSAPVVVATDAAVAAVVADAVDPRCATACLFLKDLPLAEARDNFANACGSTWPYADDDCDGLLYARNCIYAAFGNVFKRPEWKVRFEKEPWYRAKPDFKERDFSPAAAANVKALVAASKACGKPIPTITAEDRKLAEEWYDKIVVDGVTPPGVDGVEEFAKEWENHRLVDATFAYAEVPTPERREIIITALFHAVGPGKTDLGSGVVLVFDGKNQLIEVK